MLLQQQTTITKILEIVLSGMSQNNRPAFLQAVNVKSQLRWRPTPHSQFILINLGIKKWYFATKIVLTYCEKNCSSDQKNFSAFSLEFAKFLRSLEQFIQTVKGQNNSW